MRRRNPPQANRRRGAALTEFAVILPVLVLMFFGTVEACSMIHLEQSLKVAAYEATRIALVPGTTSANVTAAATQILADRDINGGAVSISPANYSSAALGTYVSVTVTAPAKNNSLVGAWFYGGRTLTSTVQMMKET